MNTSVQNTEIGGPNAAERIEELRITDLHAFYGEGHALHGID
jgi:branched-chain amino acid transport system ATP-binding protein